MIETQADDEVLVYEDEVDIHLNPKIGPDWMALATEAGLRIPLHFLPPYCPDHNRIERTWQDLHANVTRSHTCRDIAELMRQVRAYLNQRNKKSAAEYALAA